MCYTAPIPPTTQNPNPPPPPAPSDPCVPGTSPDYLRTITADGLPFFENFYAGGTNSVRGFRDNTLGPREATQPLGGAVKTVGSMEMYFPTLIKTPSARLSAFIDFGNVYRNADDFNVDTLRYSAGVAMLWRAPVGPISISYAFPISKQPGDEVERLQFTFGGQF